MLSVAIVTVTKGREELEQSIKAIDEQTYPVHNYILTDGIVSYEEYWEMVKKYRSPNRDIGYWPGRVNRKRAEGNSGGEKLWAAAPNFITEDITIMSADDDWYKPNHVESMVELIQSKNLDWAYCLRSIYSKDGRFLFDDNCESLGEHPVYDGNPGFAEGGSIAAKTDVMCAAYQAYNLGLYGVDRHAYWTLKRNFPNFSGTGLHTNCFRLGGNPNSVSSEFLEYGNEVMRLRYPNKFPWHPD